MHCGALDNALDNAPDNVLCHAQARGALSSEEQQQAILSRLLLLLGAFVMVCLLMF